MFDYIAVAVVFAGLGYIVRWLQGDPTELSALEADAREALDAANGEIAKLRAQIAAKK